MNQFIMSHPMTNLEGTIMDEGDRNTSVLLIDASKNQRAYWAEQLKRSSPGYQILEADDRHAGLAIYRSQRIDCVVLELALPDLSGFPALAELVPRPSRPQVAVVILTHLTNRRVWELAKQNGAYVCLAKMATSGEDLDKAVQRAVAFVGEMPKEDRYRPSLVSTLHHRGEPSRRQEPKGNWRAQGTSIYDPDTVNETSNESEPVTS